MKRFGARLLIGAGICIILLILGTMIGFAIGGSNPFAVFLPSTWTHIGKFLE
ncbi:DNA-directed RNA polymerase subunit beta [Lacticaseibacillus pantheris]|uniref:DNA-directed RNA polymerase subunit beta n=1 Tax=uncultured Lacticaseibacillus sp. TaxID=2775882 RepID=UPI001CDAD203|nr:DNA-directed RNA polymerase subunit beta [Lacticaseibacillus pantheris]WKF86205.1 DNA-directed RNA polymerase subunit beta [Lacticaseibacillus pantheris]